MLTTASSYYILKTERGKHVSVVAIVICILAHVELVNLSVWYNIKMDHPTLLLNSRSPINDNRGPSHIRRSIVFLQLFRAQPLSCCGVLLLITFLIVPPSIVASIQVASTSLSLDPDLKQTQADGDMPTKVRATTHRSTLVRLRVPLHSSHSSPMLNTVALVSRCYGCPGGYASCIGTLEEYSRNVQCSIPRYQLSYGPVDKSRTT